MTKAGIASGIVAYALFCVQFALIARPKCIERQLGLGNMFRAHAVIGPLAITVSFIHGFFSKASAVGISANFYSRLGGIVLALFCAIAVFSFVFLANTRFHLINPLVKIKKLGDRFGLRYDFARLSHNASLPVLILACAHASLGPEIAVRPILKYIIITMLAVSVYFWLYHKFLRPVAACTVSGVEVLGSRLLRISLKPGPAKRPSHEAGQFGYLRMHVPGLGGEYHPFAISSPPAQPGSSEAEIQVLVKVVGDWTMRLYDAAEYFPGALSKHPWKASLDYPYGTFTLKKHGLQKNANGPLVLLAGGIGISPFLSILASLARKGSTRRILVLWAAGTRDDLVDLDKLAAYMSKLPGLSTIPVLSSDPMWTGQRGLIDEAKLKDLAAYELASADASWMLCCPPPMRVQLMKTLRGLGVRRASICYENFSL